MPKLKTTLLFKVLICLVILWCLFNIFIVKYSSKYVGNETSIEGNILNYNFDDNLLKMTIKAKEKIIVNYRIKSEEEKLNLEETLGFNDYVILNGILKKPLENYIPNVFSYQKYLEHKHIYYIFESNQIKIIKNNKLIYKLKNWFYKRLERNSSNGYLKALLFGVKDDIDLDLLQENGISHLFAISGMHLSFLVLILSKFFKKRNYILLILWFYAFLVGFTPSILRSVLFFSIKSLSKEKISNLQILVLVISLMLIYDAYYIYDIGFIYSFLISFGLLTYKLDKKTKINNLFKISIFTFFISLPITASNYYKVNLSSVIFNIITIPFVSMIMYPLAILTFILPIFNIIFDGFTTIFLLMNKLFSLVTIGNLIIPKVNIFFWLIYYYLFYKAFYYHYKRFGFLLFFFIYFIHFFPIIKSDFIVTYLSVGQGDSTLIVHPHLTDVTLIDTGGVISQKDYLFNNIKTYFYSLGIDKINSLIISHGDFDHMGNAIKIVNNFKVNKVIFNCGNLNDLEKELITVLNKKRILYYSCIKRLSIGKDKLLFLNNNSYDNENDSSAVVYGNFNNFKFLFMGDASMKVENNLLEKYDLNNIDVLKVAHHGSKTSSSKEFITKIKPKYSIISVGKNNNYGHPSKETLDNLVNSKIYRTDLDGSIVFKIINNKLKIIT